MTTTQQTDALEGIKTDDVIAHYQHHGSALIRALVARLALYSRNNEAYEAGYDAGYQQALNDALEIPIKQAQAAKEAREERAAAIARRSNKFDPDGEVRGYY